MDAEKIIKKARSIICKYCIEECKAFCCRKGYLLLNKKDAEAVTGKNVEALKKKGIVKEHGEKTYISLKAGCPALKNNLCTIHRKKTRPQLCKDFPIFIKDKTISLSKNCPAITQDIIYPQISQLVRNGYKLEKIED